MAAREQRGGTQHIWPMQASKNGNQNPLYHQAKSDLVMGGDVSIKSARNEL